MACKAEDSLKLARHSQKCNSKVLLKILCMKNCYSLTLPHLLRLRKPNPISCIAKHPDWSDHVN